MSLAGEEDRLVLAVEGLGGRGAEDRGDDDRREDADREIAEQDLEDEEDAGDRGVEDRRDAGRGAAAHQRADVLAGDVEPPAEEGPGTAPICTMGPSVPAEPPLPTVAIEAKVLTRPTRSGISPLRWMRALRTWGTPWPLASLANRQTRMALMRAPTIGTAGRR
jgi:hypothetical protein